VCAGKLRASISVSATDGKTPVSWFITWFQVLPNSRLDFCLERVQVRRMKSEQLANVLIKIIGLYVCLCAIPGFVSGILLIFSSVLGATWSEKIFTTGAYAIGNVVQAGVGVCLIIKSRSLAEFWFKKEDE
jgi:hypothetical protein